MISGTTGISGATDSSFVLKGQRGSRSATLYCTGRDIEYRELPLWFSGETHTWELTEQAEEEQEPVDPKLVSLSEFLKALSIFDGTATQLSELWERRKGEQITPSVLAKRMVRYAGELESEGIHFTTSRTREARHIHIQRDGSDGSDGKNRTGA